MIVWVLAGLVLGVLLSSLLRRIAHSSLAEMTYLTFVSILDQRRQRTPPKPRVVAEAEQARESLSAAAGRISLL